MKVFTAQQMRDFDKAATQEYGIPSIVLMENAALRVVEFLEMKFAPLKGKNIVVLCGKGNNGGDGFAIARHLSNAGCDVSLALAVNAPDELHGNTLTNYQTLITTIDDDSHEAQIYLFDIEATQFHVYGEIVVDALFGTGFKGKVRDQKAKFGLGYLRSAREAKSRIVAVDLPSTLNSDTGELPTEAIHADYTVTLAAPKPAMFLKHGPLWCGEIWVGDIGAPTSLMGKSQVDCRCMTRQFIDFLTRSLWRPPDAHKGDAGRVLVIGGSYGMSGAPALAARAVLKSGAGTCVAALPDKIISTFAAAFSEATSRPLPCDENGVLIESAADELPALWEKVNAVALGPGIGRDASTLDFVRRVVKECPLPLIMDADALYALRAIESAVKNRGTPTILTPHPGEMAELMEMSTQDVQDSRIDTAIACAQKYNAIVVLKGACSIVATPDGYTHINLTGNSGMATGGSGDVLTGTIAGLLAQTKDALSATLLGVYTHGLAGDLAFDTLGNGLIAGDIADHLPRALLEIEKPLEPPVNARLRPLR